MDFTNVLSLSLTFKSRAAPLPAQALVFLTPLLQSLRAHSLVHTIPSSQLYSGNCLGKKDRVADANACHATGTQKSC